MAGRRQTLAPLRTSRTITTCPGVVTSGGVESGPLACGEPAPGTASSQVEHFEITPPTHNPSPRVPSSGPFGAPKRALLLGPDDRVGHRIRASTDDTGVVGPYLHLERLEICAPKGQIDNARGRGFRPARWASLLAVLVLVAGWDVVPITASAAATSSPASTDGASVATVVGPECGPPVMAGTTATVTCSHTDAARQWTVPAGVTSAQFDVYGAPQGHGFPADGGRGGTGRARRSPRSPSHQGEVLAVYVGGTYGFESTPSGDDLPTGGFNGGGDPGSFCTLTGSGPVCTRAGFGGGGASDVRRAPHGLGNRLVVAGGGGGFGGIDSVPGSGGGLVGGSALLDGTSATREPAVRREPERHLGEWPARRRGPRASTVVEPYGELRRRRWRRGLLRRRWRDRGIGRRRIGLHTGRYGHDQRRPSRHRPRHHHVHGEGIHHHRPHLQRPDHPSSARRSLSRPRSPPP